MFFCLYGPSATAEIKYGIGISAGQVETSGTETEGTAADTSNRSKTIKEVFGTETFLLSLYQIAV